jgi:thioredoxin 1
MQRRTLLILTAAAVLATPAFAVEPATYSPELVAQELAAGKTVLIDFSASWCPSCQTQGRHLEALREENPAYDAAITFVEADWDTYKDSPLAQQYGVSHRGSLLVLRGDAVVFQSTTHSTKDALKAMLDQVSGGA